MFSNQTDLSNSKHNGSSFKCTWHMLVKIGRGKIFFFFMWTPVVKSVEEYGFRCREKNCGKKRKTNGEERLERGKTLWIVSYGIHSKNHTV